MQSSKFIGRRCFGPICRSLHARRMLREGILHWSEPPSSGRSIQCDDVQDPAAVPQSIGVRNAWRALNVAVQSRMRRELSRFKLETGRKTA